MIFVRYKLGTKGYKFWDPETRSVVVSRDATFNETSFPHCTNNSSPPVQPEQPNQAQQSDDFFPEESNPEVPRPDASAPARNDDPQCAQVEDADSESDDNDLYINRPYSPQPKSELEPDFDWDKRYQQYSSDPKETRTPSHGSMPQGGDQASPHAPLSSGSRPQGPTQNIPQDLNECRQQKSE